MPRVAVGLASAGNEQLRLFSLAVVLVPAVGALLLPASAASYEALLWLTVAVPALLLGRDRGWEGIGLTLGVTVVVGGATYVAAAAAGQSVPALLPAVAVALLGLCLGIGWLAQGVTQPGSVGGAGDEVIDRLTGLPTRSQAQLFLEKEFEAAQLGRPLVVVLFELDQFREFTQHHGVAAGNGVLKAFSTLLRQSTRRMNLSARWGTAEFVGVLCGSSQEGSLIFAERVQELLRAASGTTPLPTVSAGIATYRPNMSTPTELVAAAQEALDQAKEDGGDRIRLYGTSIQPDSVARTAEAARAVMTGEYPEQPETRPERIGIGRSAFVSVADSSARTQLVRYLAAQGFRVTEGIWPHDSILPLKEDYDILLADVGGAGAAWAELVEEIRDRSPATRIVGIPRLEGETIGADVLAVRVDGYCVVSGDAPAFHPGLPELLRERDRQLERLLRERQLTGEVRAKEREGRLALEESEARYRSVVQRIKEVIFEADREGRLTFLNPAWTAITGITGDDALGNNLLDFIHPEERAAVHEEHAALVSGSRPYVRRELRLRTAGGGVRWVELRAQAARSATSDIVGVSGLMSDVHERKQAMEALRRSEEYFRSLIENSADIMAVLDEEGRFRYASPALERVLGFSPEERAGRSAFELVHVDDVEEARRTFSEVGTTPGTSAFMELRVLHKDGSWRWLELLVRNLSHEPSVQGLVVNGRDVTDRKAAERRLRESEELLFRAQKMDAIGRVAGGVAHDFNNLLTAIHGNADLVLERLAATDSLRDEVSAIRDAAIRATSLTRQLLAFSRKQVLQPRVVDLRDVVRPMQKMLDGLLGDDTELRLNVSAELPATKVDPQQIEQAILNLALNARDAMPSGGSLDVQLASATLHSPQQALGEEIPAGNYVVITVRDTGSGIPADVLEQVFDPFFTTRPGSGAGLGLSTVYGIIKQSGGFIDLQSQAADATDPEHPSGTTFRIYLPAVSERPLPTRGRGVESRASGGSETIALVEDEKAVRDLAARILRNKGYNVIAAEHGDQAIDLIGRYPDRIDLLLTDVVMPEMNGRELADRISGMRPDVKVLFMSGYTEDAIVQHGVLTDGTAFLQKPFSPDGLATAVRAVLDSPSRVKKPPLSQRPPGLPGSRQNAQ